MFLPNACRFPVCAEYFVYDKTRVLLDNNVMEVVLPNKVLEYKPSHVSHLDQGFRALFFAAAGHSSGPSL